MPTESKWEAPAAIVSYLTTELNSLADGANVLGAKIDNVADGENEMFVNLELNLASTSSRDADARIEIYILYSVDDTNFDMGSASVDPRPESLLTVLSLDAATTARYRTAVNLPIQPFDFKLLVMNEIGQSFFGSGSTLKYRLHSAEAQ
tara:strand:- start:255 stop:701 length:447 start_codon:yes stop_codon:yes gene_type:complete